MRRGALATGFRSALRNLPIVFSERTSRGFMRRRRPHHIGDIGGIGAAFWDRAVAITTITIGWFTLIGHISTERRPTQGTVPPQALWCAPSPLR